MCKVSGCLSENGVIDGYCRTHAGRAVSDCDPLKISPFKHGALSKDNCSNKELKRELERTNSRMDAFVKTMIQLQNENTALVNEVAELKEALTDAKTENEKIKARVNLNFSAIEQQNNYGRKESLKIRNFPEAADPKTEDVFNAVKKVATDLGIDVTENDIQRCHRVGKKKTFNGNSRIRPIIVKFKSYKKRMEFMDNKKKLFPNVKKLSIEERKKKISKSVFITEDLSPFRAKMFRHIRDFNKNKDKFDVVTTNNGDIVVKTLGSPEKEGWRKIHSPEDFLSAGIPMDFDEFKEILQ